MASVACVSEADLRAFLLGDLPDRVAQTVSTHLETCPDCETAARRLDGVSDPMIQGLRRVLGPARPTDQTGATGLAPLPDPDAGHEPVRRVGGYEILEELGRGGAGVVYKARQTHPARVVALKMILTGADATAEQRRRFLAEADAIARLQHPHIVQIYEVGQHEGLPFLALEYLDGGSLARALGGVPLPPHEAAELLEMLARAVQYAHAMGVVHRDLKPANILLRRKSEIRSPKSEKEPISDFELRISDFGLARYERSELTATGQVLGTPSYMAPEQAAGANAAVGPAADVYALGAILYELLTGRPPFQGATVLETLEQVRTQEPVPPVQLQPKTPRDLNTICLKCLQKEPARRYASAADLADDLRRFLDGQVIRARPVGSAERLWRWGRRNPRVAVLLGLLGASLAGGAATATWLWRRAEHQRDQASTSAQEAIEQRQRAEANRDRALDAVDRFLTRLGDEGLKAVPGMDDVRRELLEDALAFQQGFLRDKDSPDPGVRRGVGLAYQRVAAIHRWLGQREQAERSLIDALPLQRQLAADHPDEPLYRRDLGQTYHFLAIEARRANRPRAQIEDAFRQALDVREDLARRFPAVTDYQIDLASTLTSYGLHFRPTDPGRARELYDRVLAIYEALVLQQPEVMAHHENLANINNKLGALAFATNQLAEAEARFARACDLWDKAGVVKPRAPTLQNDRASGWSNLGTVYAAAGRDAEAAAAYEKSLAVRTRLAADHPAIPAYAVELARVRYNLGTFHLDRGRWGPARPHLEEALAVLTPLAERQPADTSSQQVLAGIRVNLGKLEYTLGRWDEAIQHHRAAAAILAALVQAQPRALDAAEGLGVACLNQAMALTAAGRPDEALPPCDRAISALEEVYRRQPRHGQAGPAAVRGHWLRGDIHARLGDLDKTLTDWERAVGHPAVQPSDVQAARPIVDGLRRAVGGDHAAATAAVEATAGSAPKWPDPATAQRLAQVYALAAAAAGRDGALTPDERTRLADAYADRAAQALTRGQREGSFHAADRRQFVLTDPLLAPVRGRPAFQDLLRAWESAPIAPPPK